MRHSIYIVALTIVLLCASCGNQDQFTEFNSVNWKNDRMACQGKRKAMKADFEKIRQKLKGLDQMEIIEVLGKPDVQRLDDRHTKSYLYFLEPGPSCTNNLYQSNAQNIIIRFNSVDRAFEILYDQGMPL